MTYENIEMKFSYSIRIGNMSSSAEKDVDVPTIIHDKNNKEYRLTLQNLPNKNKVR